MSYASRAAFDTGLCFLWVAIGGFILASGIALVTAVDDRSYPERFIRNFVVITLVFMPFILTGAVLVSVARGGAS